MEPKTKKNQVLLNADEILTNPDLLNEPKSVLLFHIFKLLKIFHPDLADSYWGELLKISNHLPSEYRVEFSEHEKTFTPRKEAAPGGFKGEILKEIEESIKKKTEDPVASKEILLDCIKKINKRWWSFGNGSLWQSLVPALFETDHSEAFKVLRKLPGKIRRQQVVSWNDKTPLSVEEWKTLDELLGSEIKDIIMEILDKEDKTLNIPEHFIETLASTLINDIHYYVTGETTEALKTGAENRRDKAFSRFQSLLTSTHKAHDDLAMKIMMSYGNRIMVDSIYNSEKNWVTHMSDIRAFLNFWVKITDERDKVTDFLKTKTPKHLRGFALAQWYAISSTTDEQTEEAFKLLATETTDKLASQAWFLIILILTGRGQLAYNLSKHSVNPKELTPRVIRQWILYDSKEVLNHIPTEEQPTDLISHFLLLPTLDEKMQYLREQTNHGNESLPKAMWKLPDINRLYSTMEKGEFIPLNSEEHLFTTFFFTSEKTEKQFIGYIIQYGFGQYSYLEIDDSILKVLNYWEEKYPSEVSNLCYKMWSGFIPDNSLVRLDVLRNAIFERYRNVFSAHPETLHKYFVKWIKKEFVDSSRQWTIGNMTYTFSLKDIVPFIYCLQSARKIGDISPKKCDQILVSAIEDFASESSLMNSAASIYAADKETLPVNPPCKMYSNSLLKDWQMGVIQTSMKRSTNAIIKELTDAVLVS